MTGSGTLLDPFVIWDDNDLQDIELDPTAYYELGQNINAVATAGWNGGLGFNPIRRDTESITKRPTGDDSATGTWTIFPADGIMWDKVNEVVPDEDARYIQADANPSRALLSTSAFTLPATVTKPAVGAIA